MGNIVAGLQNSAEAVLGSANLEGKTVIITGGSSGIGLETVRVLALGGARVIIGAPNREKAESAVQRIKPDAGKADISIKALDLSSFTSIRKFAKEILDEDKAIDILILNAAVMQTPQWLTREGFEFQLGVNYLGHVELAKNLLEHQMLGQETPSRLIVVTCKLPMEEPHHLSWRDMNFKTRTYSSGAAYAQSKIALAIWGGELSRRLTETNVGVFIVHPGVAVTRLNRFLPLFSVIYDSAVAPFVKTIAQAAATTVHCAVSSKAWSSGHGAFFENAKEAKAPGVMNNATLAANLWQKTEELLAEAKVDSHEPIDYNYGRVLMTNVFNQFYRRFILPFLQSLRLSKEKPV